MKTSFNMTTSICDIERFPDRKALLDVLAGFDGIELMCYNDDTQGIVTPDMVTGVHLKTFTYWLDYWNGDTAALDREFGNRETWLSVYGGDSRENYVNRLRAGIRQAHGFGAEYVVFHVADCSMEEAFTGKFHNTDEDVVDASCDLLNELFREEDGSIALLVENLWHAGFTFTRPEITEHLMRGIRYPNKGIMLDTGHLLHTNPDIATQEQGIGYIHSMLDLHGDLSRYIRGVHLNQSVTGDYVRKIRENPPVLSSDYGEKARQLFAHIFKVDRHRPFTAEGVSGLMRRISPEYLTYEFITSDLEDLKMCLASQRRALAGFYLSGTD